MVSGLPNGLELMDALQAMGPNAQQCVQFAGTPTQEGSFDIEIEGVLTIQLFGTPTLWGIIHSPNHLHLSQCQWHRVHVRVCNQLQPHCNLRRWQL